MRSDARRPAAWLALGLLGTLLSPRVHAAPTPLPSRPTQYATDRALAFPPARLAALNEKLAAFERATSNQVLVYVDRSLPPGTTVEEMGAAAIREWGVGQKGKSNGVVFFVFTDDRAMRLEVGYGLEGILPDARARQITSDVVKPFFKKGDYAGGIEAGVDAILAAARGEGFQGTGHTTAESRRPRGETVNVPGVAALVSLGLTALFGLVFRRSPRQNPRFYVFLALILFGLSLLTGGVIAGQIGWAVGGLLLAFGGILTAAILRAAAEGAPASPSSSPWSSSSSSSSWDSSSSSPSSSSSSPSESSSSSSDFSGGGGDGGGGGSSDSW